MRAAAMSRSDQMLDPLIDIHFFRCGIVLRKLSNGTTNDFRLRYAMRLRELREQSLCVPVESNAECHTYVLRLYDNCNTTGISAQSARVRRQWPFRSASWGCSFSSFRLR